MYTLTAYNQSGIGIGFWVFDTWSAFVAHPRVAGLTYVFDVIS